MTPEEVATCVGRYGKVPQCPGNELARKHGPYFYGRVVEVHSSGKAVKVTSSSFYARWYAIADVLLHPLKEGEGACQPTE